MTPGTFRCEVYADSRPRSGVANMALDEALLERSLATGTCQLRLYRWAEPTVSLGYFQEYAPETLPAALQGLAVVRRLSGGGAILHHHELTYACCVPAEHRWAAAPTELYVAVHEVFIGLLAERGVTCRMRGAARVAAGGEPFLCFARGDERDVLLGADKVLGSAQRRRKGAVVQHGSLLLRRSPHAPEFPGLEDLAGTAVGGDWEGFEAELRPRLAALLGQVEEFPDWPTEVLERAGQLEAERYRYPGRRFGRESSE